jgi:formylglycine-generating enzyme required for sulfatase activity
MAVSSASRIPHTFTMAWLMCAHWLLANPSLRSEDSASKVTATAQTRLSTPLIHPALPGLTLVWCPPGTFRMGSPKEELGRFANEAPAETTLTNGFFIQSTELTQEQWVALQGSNPSSFPNPANPVEMVNWEDATGFCEELTRKSLAKGLIPEGWRFDLPTEAQWEYACRAGTTSALNDGSNLTSKTGADPGLDPLAWYEANSEQAAHPVAGKKPNAWGLYDMHGNLWEWCRDWFEFKLKGSNDPSGPAEGSSKVIRGGSWYIGSPSFCRSAYRSSYGTERRISHLGFRLALVRSPRP